MEFNRNMVQLYSSVFSNIYSYKLQSFYILIMQIIYFVLYLRKNEALEKNYENNRIKNCFNYY